MITASTKIRVLIFVILGLAGITNIAFRYLGVDDVLLGRGYTVTAQLPSSGGLYTGGQVTVRGVAAGEIRSMTPNPQGVRVELHLEDDVPIPKASPFRVHNGSAVGEQYLDFVPPGHDGPFLEDGDHIEAGAEALPIDEGDLLLDLNRFVTSVDTDNLSTVVSELGLMFNDTGSALQSIIDGANQLLGEAQARQDDTISLLDTAQVVLTTQEQHAADITRFSDGISKVAAALRAGDKDIRALLNKAPKQLTELDKLFRQLRPTLPLLLSNLVTANQTVAIQLPAVEQLLVSLPVMIAGAFSGTTSDGWGYVGIQFTPFPAPCSQGYLPLDEWRPGVDTTDPVDQSKYDRVSCTEPLPVNARGTKYAPRPGKGVARVAPGISEHGQVSTPSGDSIKVIDPRLAAESTTNDWRSILLAPTGDSP